MGSDFGPLPSLEDMLGKPEFSADGRFHIIPVPSILHELVVRPWEFIAPFRDQGTIIGVVGVILIVPLTVYGGLRHDWGQWRHNLTPFLCLALSSVALYVVARILLFKLFLPSRYLEYSVNIGYCFLLGSCLHGLFSKAWPTSRDRAIVCLAIVFVLGCYRNTQIGLFDYSEKRALYAAIQKTPVNSIISGHPYDMDNVLTFGRRNVFASFELAHPWNLGYWKRLRSRLEAQFDAYYAADLKDVAAFCRDNHIDYLVVNRHHFTKKFLNGKPFFAPFDAQIQQRAAKTQTYALSSPEGWAERIDENLFLIDTKALFKESDNQ